MTSTSQDDIGLTVRETDFKQDVTVPNVAAVAEKKRAHKKKPNYAAIHKDSLPLTVYPLPAFHPTNPISLIALAWAYAKQIVRPPRSLPAQKYVGYLSLETRSVHVTDAAHVRALWERGFFGKGILSRSEPSWMDREKARLEARAQGGQTAEENTKARRKQRRLFKLERARAETEKIALQRAVEQGTQSAEPVSTNDNVSDVAETQQALPSAAQLSTEDATKSIDLLAELQIEDQEHLQLTLEEAYFLKHSLGVLDIKADNVALLESGRSLFNCFRASANISPSAPGMDDTFVLSYVVYHHFRSLGWVVRPGVKFSVDYLLYYRGPALSHAEFAIMIMPTYSHPFWSTPDGAKLKRKDDRKDWWWFHCMNRVQSQVYKTLVLCYVDIPPPTQDHERMSVRRMLSQYSVREFTVRRWLMNRSRD